MSKSSIGRAGSKGFKSVVSIVDAKAAIAEAEAAGADAIVVDVFVRSGKGAEGLVTPQNISASVLNKQNLFEKDELGRERGTVFTSVSIRAPRGRAPEAPAAPAAS